MRRLKEQSEFFIVDNMNDIQSGFRLLVPIRKEINSEFYTMVYNKYFDAVPLNQISDILEKYNMYLIQEDGTPWSGLLLGASGEVKIDLAHYDNYSNSYLWIKNSDLQLQWYKMASGRYEINLYLG